jgi:hypothetical protein
MESIKVQGIERYQSVYVSTIDDSVWVNVQTANGSANTRLSLEGAEKLIEALQAAIGSVGASLDVRYQNEPVEAAE